MKVIGLVRNTQEAFAGFWWTELPRSLAVGDTLSSYVVGRRSLQLVVDHVHQMHPEDVCIVCFEPHTALANDLLVGNVLDDSGEKNWHRRQKSTDHIDAMVEAGNAWLTAQMAKKQKAA